MNVSVVGTFWIIASDPHVRDYLLSRYNHQYGLYLEKHVSWGTRNGEIRTQDLWILTQPLYHLSYRASVEFLEFTCNCYHRSIVNFVRKNVEHCRQNFTSIFSFFAVWRYGRSSDFLNFGEISSFRNIEKTRCQLFHFLFVIKNLRNKSNWEMNNLPSYRLHNNLFLNWKPG